MAAVRTIAVTNQKGGVGKTTTVANLGAALARRGLNVCLIDLDPQAHLTLHFGIDPARLTTSTYDVMTGQMPLGRAAVLVEPHLTVVPSAIDLAGAEVELAGEVGREQILRDRIASQPMAYELILVDCPPSLGVLTLNALAAVEEILIPLQGHFLALQGLGTLLETVSLVQRRINPGLKVAGVIFCMFESGTRLAVEVAEDVRQFFDAARAAGTPWSGARIFRTRIRRNIKLAECPSHGTTILQYEPSSHGAEDYRALADEFLGVFFAERASTAQRPGSETEFLPAPRGLIQGRYAAPPSSGESATGESAPPTPDRMP
jgi:chromosome partitioning protein